jgi:hypothetical protein
VARPRRRRRRGGRRRGGRRLVQRRGGRLPRHSGARDRRIRCGAGRRGRCVDGRPAGAEHRRDLGRPGCHRGLGCGGARRAGLGAPPQDAVGRGVRGSSGRAAPLRAPRDSRDVRVEAAEVAVVGNLLAAGSVCTYSVSPPTPIVEFRTAAGDVGILFIPVGPSARNTPDLCVRHLVGPWWAYRTLSLDCPFGYRGDRCRLSGAAATPVVGRCSVSRRSSAAARRRPRCPGTGRRGPGWCRSRRSRRS